MEEECHVRGKRRFRPTSVSGGVYVYISFVFILVLDGGSKEIFIPTDISFLGFFSVTNVKLPRQAQAISPMFFTLRVVLSPDTKPEPP